MRVAVRAWELRQATRAALVLATVPPKPWRSPALPASYTPPRLGNACLRQPSS